MNLEVFRRRADLHLSGLRALAEECIKDPKLQKYFFKRVIDLQRAADTTQESDLIAHTIFREPVSSREDAERLLRYLHDGGMAFHPDEDPADLACPVFNEDEARELRHRMREIGELPGFDPCEFYLFLWDPEDDMKRPLPESITSH